MTSSFKTRTRAVRYAVISDVHLGNKRNSARNIIANLNEHISNVAFISTLDILFIAGDLFDEMLYLSADEVGDIQVWMGNLLAICRKLKVKLRVLEGTPSHDRHQSRLFMRLDEIQMQSGKYHSDAVVDLKYFEILDIEYMEDLDLSILYIPDEWGPTTEDTYAQVLALMKERGIEYVDIAMMHGLFTYQLPENIPHIPRHNEESYLSIVRYLISIGHIHTFSTYSRIIAEGSFDRLSHNEEEPKGFVVVELSTDDTYTAEFIENTGAAIFKTISCTEMDMAESLEYIESAISNIPSGANLRIEASASHAIGTNLAVIKTRWPDYIWTFIGRDKGKKEKKALVDSQRTYVPIVLDRQTLADVVIERLLRMGLSGKTFSLCTDIIKLVTKI